jgi:hypothetical protein
VSYTVEQLAVVCPLCHAAKGARCLSAKRDGMDWIANPHPERVQAAEQEDTHEIST